MRFLIYISLVTVYSQLSGCDGVPPIDLRYDDLTSTSIRPITVLSQDGDTVRVRIASDDENSGTEYIVNLTRALQYRRCIHGAILQERGVLPDPSTLTPEEVFTQLQKSIAREDYLAVRHLVPAAYRANSGALKTVLRESAARGHALCALEYGRVVLRDLYPEKQRIQNMQFSHEYERTAAWCDIAGPMLQDFSHHCILGVLLGVSDAIRQTRTDRLAHVAQKFKTEFLELRDYHEDAKRYHESEGFSNDSLAGSNLHEVAPIYAGKAIEKVRSIMDTRELSGNWVLHALAQDDRLPSPAPLGDLHKKAINEVFDDTEKQMATLEEAFYAWLALHGEIVFADPQACQTIRRRKTYTC